MGPSPAKHQNYFVVLGDQNQTTQHIFPPNTPKTHCMGNPISLCTTDMEISSDTTWKLVSWPNESVPTIKHPLALGYFYNRTLFILGGKYLITFFLP